MAALNPPKPSGSSNPILISPNKQGNRNNKLTHQPKKNFTAHSCPPLRYEPPKAPAPRPRSPPCDPPPIELPPSPPIFSVEDVANEIQRQRNEHLARAGASAPLSRSLTNGWSGPRNFSFLNQAPGSFRPHFPSVSEEDNPFEKNKPTINLSESPSSSTAEYKAPHSYSDSSSTIFSMMLRKNSLAASPNATVLDGIAVPSSILSHRASTAGFVDDPDLQFSISLDQHEESSMLHGASDSSSTNYTLNFRD